MRNAATTDQLYKMIKLSEDTEMKTFDLRDRKRELKHDLEVNDDLDTEVANYLKFEKEKNKKREAVLA